MTFKSNQLLLAEVLSGTVAPEQRFHIYSIPHKNTVIAFEL